MGSSLGASIFSALALVADGVLASPADTNPSPLESSLENCSPEPRNSRRLTSPSPLKSACENHEGASDGREQPRGLRPIKRLLARLLAAEKGGNH